MTPDPPTRPAGRNRPDRSFRRRSLGIPAPDVESHPLDAAPGLESLTASLARIPDRQHDASLDDAPADSSSDAFEPEPDPDPAAESESRTAPTASVHGDIGSEDDRVPADGLAPSSPRRRPRTTSSAPRPPWWRSAGFAVILVVLVAAIPLLGREGYRVITRSADGTLVDEAVGRNDPNYEEQVQSTPTGVLIQTDAEGNAVALTVLALTADKGGTVIFVPLDTKLSEQAFGVDRLRLAYSGRRSVPARAREALTGEVAKILNAGIDQTVDLDNRGFAQVVAPVAPLIFDNLAPLDLAGFGFEAGPIELGPDLVGPYLGYLYEGEDQLSQFARQELVWRAWFEAVAEADAPGAVPGDPATGIGLFVPKLAAGPVNFVTLPGSYDEAGLYVPDPAAVNDMVVAAIPVPDAAYPGSRAVVRILNGVAPGPPPPEVTRAVARYGGTLSVVGNASSFDRVQTDVIYREPEMKRTAELLLGALGADGEAILDPQANDTVDITVLLGPDVLDDLAAIQDDPAPTTEATTTVPSGGT